MEPYKATGITEKIIITPDMIINDIGPGNLEAVCDEQDAACDSVAGMEGKPVSSVKKAWDNWQNMELTASVTIDLGAQYKVASVWVYNSEQNDLIVSAGTPFSWETVIKVKSTAGSWAEITLDCETHYINLSFVRDEAPIEVAVYGYQTDYAEVPPEAAERKYPIIDKFIGLNGFIDDTYDVLSVGGYVREYHNWNWCDTQTDYPDNTMYYFPSTNGAWNFDEYYTNLKALGVSVVPCIQLNSTGFIGTYKSAKLTDESLSQIPSAYEVFAAHIFQYIARYGAAKVSACKLKVAKNQSVKTGLDVLGYIEITNEPNMTWSGRESYFTPYELAACMSACYDGHEGTITGSGADIGAKTADPGIKVSLGGLDGIRTDYIRAMAFWTKYNRNDGELPFDVINVHKYCFAIKAVDDDGIKKTVQVGISPEEGGLAEAVAELVDWRNRYAPDREVWLTEFGYDTNQSYNTAQSSHAYGNYTGRQVQAIWLIRSYLILSATGIERSAMFMSRDSDTEDTEGKYVTCGIITSTGEKKDSYYYIATLKNTLTGMRFAEKVDSGDMRVWIYRYECDDNHHTAYVLWCPTSNGTGVDGYLLKLGTSTATLVQFAYGTVYGNKSRLNVVCGYVPLNVSETPIIVFVS